MWLNTRFIYFLLYYLISLNHVKAQKPVYTSPKEIFFEKVPISNAGLYPDDDVTALFEEENGIIWMVAGSGLLRYNGNTLINVSEYLQTYHRQKIDVQNGKCFYMENNKTIWYGGMGGLYKIEPDKGKATQIFLDTALHSKNFRNDIYNLAGNGDTLFVGTANGFYLVDKRKDKVLASYLNNGLDYGHRFTSKNVHAIMPNVEPGIVWLAMGDGMYRLNTTTGDTSHYVSPTQVWEYSHHYYPGILYNRTLLMPSYGNGLVEFDLDTKKFTDRKTIDKGENSWAYNIIYSAVPLNDSISLIIANKLGVGLYNRLSKKYEFIESPADIRNNGSFIMTDSSGYAWAGNDGSLYRTTQPVLHTKKNDHHVIDITALNVNGVLIKIPALDGYENIKLGEDDNNIDLEFSVSKAYILDSVQYRYRLDDGAWKFPETANQLTLFNLPSGKHKLQLTATSHGKEIASRMLSFSIHQGILESAWFLPSVLLLLFGIILLYRELKNRQRRKEEAIQFAYEQKLTELKAESLRSQINPHFIFNTLNSIKYYSLKKSKEETGDFITKFSQLIRQILENSKESLIPLENEIATLVSYINIEKLRFRNEFNHIIKIDDNINMEFMVPPMIIQPFVENAIWHGLMHKDENRQLTTVFNKIENGIECRIIDNGIGRVAAQKIKVEQPHKSSMGLKITEDRLQTLSQIYYLKSSFVVNDLYDADGMAAGTEVIICFTETNHGT